VGAVDVPVIASTGTNDTAHSVALTKAAKACGVDAVLAVTPYYNRPSAAGLSAHFRAVAAASDLPVSSTTSRSGRVGRIGTALTLELAREVPTIVGVKDATGDVAAAATVVAREPGRFRRLLR
jgi:4-hydroxy-tetrahydrodipicolinate synthase